MTLTIENGTIQINETVLTAREAALFGAIISELYHLSDDGVVRYTAGTILAAIERDSNLCTSLHSAKNDIVDRIAEVMGEF